MTKPDRNRYEYAIIFVRTYEKKNDTKTNTKSDTKYDTKYNTKFARKMIQKAIQKAIQKTIEKTIQNLSRICTEAYGDFVLLLVSFLYLFLYRMYVQK